MSEIYSKPSLSFLPFSVWEGLNRYSTNIFAGTYDGVFLSTNNGTNWTLCNNGLTDTYSYSLVAFDNNIYAGTNHGVFLSSNNGTSWTAINTGLTTRINALAVSGTNIYAGINASGIYHSTNNGTSWVYSGLKNTEFSSLAISGSNLFAGTSSGVFVSTNNGSTWAVVNGGLINTNINALAISGTNIFAGTSGGGVFLLTNIAASWTTVKTGLPITNVRAIAVSGSSLFVGTDSNGVWRRPLTEMITILAPPAPLLDLPTDRATSVTINPSLSWHASNGALSYQLQVSIDSNFSTTVVDQSGITSTSYSVTGLSSSKIYYWRVNASNISGTGLWSAIQSFATIISMPDKVALISPATGGNIGADSVQFIWRKSSPSVLSYELELSGDSTTVKVSIDTTVRIKIPANKTEKVFSWRVRAKNTSGFGSFSNVWSFLRLTTSVSQFGATPKGFALLNVFPNPFNPTTNISFSLPSQAVVLLQIYDALGKVVSVESFGEMPAGTYFRKWNCIGLPSGIYFCRLQAGSFTETKKLLLLR